MIKYFNINIKEKPSNQINKKNYMQLKFPKGFEKISKKQRRRIEYNYDLNMKYFESLDYNDFNEKLSNICKKYDLKEIINLETCNKKAGIYIMVLDKYKQVYIGLSNTNLKDRIIRHWQNYKTADRLIFGTAYSSILSIDSFGALDTTRIFIKEVSEIGKIYLLEERIVNEFDSGYILNRTAGGIGDSSTYTDGNIYTKMAVIANKKERNFFPFIDEKRLYEICDEYELERYEEEK